MNVLVAGSGSLENMELFKEIARECQLLICADGGARFFQRAGIVPHILLGDFDSIESDFISEYEQKGVEIVKFPAHKDYTDMELALDCAVERGATRVFMMGATGTRLDHTLSNLQLLHKLLDAGVNGVIVNDNNYFYLIDSQIELARLPGYKLSLVPATGIVEGVTTDRLAYPLHDFTMKMGTGLGISNEFIADKARVTITKGRLYVILSKD